MAVLQIEDSKLWHLVQCPLFSQMSGSERRAVLAAMHLVQLNRNEIVPPPPGDEPSLYIVKRGHVELSFVDEEGREAAVMILSPGDVFGALSEDIEAPYGEHCRSITPTCLCAVSRRKFELLLQKFPDLAFRLTKLSMMRIQRLQVRMADMMMRPVDARLAIALIELDQQVGRDLPEGAGRKLTLPLSHADLARLVGSSREMVTIILKKLRQAHIVDTPQRWIVIKDMPKLRELAGGKSLKKLKAEVA